MTLSNSPLSPDEKARLFLAIEITQPLHKIIFDTMDCLKSAKSAEKIHWTPKHKLHITLRFLGNVPQRKIPVLIDKITTALKSIAPFDITLGQLIALPNFYYPRIIALSIVLNADLAKLSQSVEETLILEGFAPENRKYLPHITLGRAKQGSYQLQPLLNLSFPKESQKVQGITLFRSDPEPKAQGTVYSVVQRFYLAPFSEMETTNKPKAVP